MDVVRDSIGLRKLRKCGVFCTSKGSLLDETLSANGHVWKSDTHNGSINSSECMCISRRDCATPRASCPLLSRRLAFATVG